jgi:hypothetical protein
VRAGGGRTSSGAEQVLDRDRQALEQAGLAPGEPGIGGLRHLERQLRRLGDEGVEVAGALHRLEVRRREVDRRELARGQPAPRLGEPEAGDIGHHSTTFGTTK